MTHPLNWRVGFEIELLAPVGKSRLDLAKAIANTRHGKVQRFFHPQAEPSLVEGKPIFHNLTLGFKVLDADSQWIASCVDDLTLQNDLIRQAPPLPDWYRIISDDERLLHLVHRQAEPDQNCAEVLQPIGMLFGTSPEPGPGGMFRVNDLTGASIAIAAPLPGERQRPCELITAPMDNNHHAQLEALLQLAKELDFCAPIEGATHIHFDGTAVQSADAMANLIQLLWTYGETLKQLMGTNPYCRRLGAWPSEIATLASAPEFRKLSWSEAKLQLSQTGLSKFCDFNLLNCIHPRPTQNTIEVRILPVWLDSQPILEAASLFIELLNRAADKQPVDPHPPKPATRDSCKALLELVRIPEVQQNHWLRKLGSGNP